MGVGYHEAKKGVVIFMQLGNNIRHFRKQSGLSQEQLAERVQVTRQTISNWELGETSPNPEQLALLSDALGRSIDELMGRTPASPPEPSPDEARKEILLGFAGVGGLAAAVWSFSANRFRNSEMLWITLAGVGIGFCVGMICHGLCRCLGRRKP